MILFGTTVAAMLLAPLQRPDTTITVPAGTRLEVENVSGQIVVDTWARREVRVAATYGPRDGIELEASRSVVRVAPDPGPRGGGPVNFTITVPQDLDLELEGVAGDIQVTGTRAGIEASTVEGNIRISGGAGRVSAEALSGSVSLEGIDADVEVGVMSGNITLVDIRGDVDAETVSGNIRMERIQSRSVGASTVSGNIRFSGAVLSAGRYEFESHNGLVILELPAQASAEITARSFSGTIRNALRGGATVSGGRGGEQSFLLGDGSAQIEIETFNGRVELLPQAPDR